MLILSVVACGAPGDVDSGEWDKEAIMGITVPLYIWKILIIIEDVTKEWFENNRKILDEMLE